MSYSQFLLFTPDPLALEVYTVTLTVTDDDGATDTDTQQVPVNATDDSVTAPAITSFTVNGKASDSVAPNTKVTLAWDISGTVTEVLINPGNLNVTSDDDKKVEVTPPITPAMTTYTISAKNGSASAKTKTVAVTVTADQSKPVAVPKVTSGAPDNVATTGTAVNLSESDSTGEKPFTYMWTLEVPADSKAALNDVKSATPTFTLDKPGEYKLTLVVTDKNNVSSEPKPLTVEAKDPATAMIEAKDDTATVDQDSSNNIINVLKNDTPTTGLKVVSVETFSNGGAATIQGDETLSYTPAAGYSGTETFKYTVEDGDIRTLAKQATVTVTINAAVTTSQ